MTFSGKWNQPNPPHDPIPILHRDEVVAGLLLGDAFISKHTKNKGNSRIGIGQSPTHIEFLYHIQKYFWDLGLESTISTTTDYNKTIKKFYDNCKLQTRKNPTITEMRYIWYPDGKKIVPKDLIMTPKILAYWFQCDGSSHWQNNGMSVDVQISTASFTEEDVRMLNKKLHRLNLDFNIFNKAKKYWILRTASQRNNERFMNLIEPYIIPCFRYKIKHIPKFNPKLKHTVESRGFKK